MNNEQKKDDGATAGADADGGGGPRKSQRPSQAGKWTGKLLSIVSPQVNEEEMDAFRHQVLEKQEIEKMKKEKKRSRRMYAHI